MNDIVKKQEETSHFHKFETLQAGQYWRARADYPNDGIDEGEVLLIRSITWVDNEPHTIVLRSHPGKIGSSYKATVERNGETYETKRDYGKHEFLVDEFIEKFEFEPDHERIREQELAVIQGRINALQADLVETQSNPAKMREIIQQGLAEMEDETEASNLPAVIDPEENARLISLARGTVANALTAGVNEASLASMRSAANQQHKIATIQSNWMSSKTQEISKTISAMTPFYEEKAAAALAATEDVRSYVAKLMDGIASLDLYVGKDVEVETLREGPSAPKSEPLTITQRKLFMDEELSAWADIDETFDFKDDKLFVKALLEHEDLVQQIFPAQRCVVIMATTRRYIDYRDQATNEYRNGVNKHVFMLVRDGVNIHRVYSPVSTHIKAERLFPSQNEQNGIFRGFDGTNIKFDDVAFGERHARHERFALHYKRFLLLICGLDHREKLFGEFYDEAHAFNFMSLGFQERYLRFIHDDDGEGMLPGENRPTFPQWIQKMNSYLQSGSRVLCVWDNLMTEQSAPAAFSRQSFRGTGREQRYEPNSDADVAIVFREKADLFVSVDVSGMDHNYEKRSFTCKVRLTNAAMSYGEAMEQRGNGLAKLCLDAIDPDELRWYIGNRGARERFCDYIRTFKLALRQVEEDRAAEADTRARLKQALIEGDVAPEDQLDKLIDRAVVAWRAANRGASLPVFEDGAAPKEWEALLNQIHGLAGAGDEDADRAAEFAKAEGYKPLRLVMTGRGSLVLYTEPRPEECDNRFEPHAWVHRHTIKRGKTKIIEASRRWATLPARSAKETVLFEWDAERSTYWTEVETLFPSMAEKQRFFDIVEGGIEKLKRFQSPMSSEEYDRFFGAWHYERDEMNLSSKFVENPSIFIPIGFKYENRGTSLVFVGVKHRWPEQLLRDLAPDHADMLRAKANFIRVYQKKDSAIAKFESEEGYWSLGSMTASEYNCHNDFGLCDESGFDIGKSYEDPLLNSWFKEELASNLGQSVWISAAVLDDHGALKVDEILNIKRPDNYERLTGIYVTVEKDREDVVKWFDIVPEDKADLYGSRGWEKSKVIADAFPGDGFSVRQYSQQFYNRADVEAYGRRMGPEGIRWVPANEVEGSIVPPEGVVRWIAVPKVEADDAVE